MIIEHPFYGNHRSVAHFHPEEVEQAIVRLSRKGSGMLFSVTDGVHMHTVEAEREEQPMISKRLWTPPVFCAPTDQTAGVPPVRHQAIGKERTCSGPRKRIKSPGPTSPLKASTTSSYDSANSVLPPFSLMA